MDVNKDLAKERNRTTFKVRELTEFLYEGPKNYNDMLHLRKLDAWPYIALHRIDALPPPC